MDTRNDTDGWQNTSDIYGVRITPDGELLDGPPNTGGIAINTAPYPKYFSRVTFDGDKFLVVWELNRDYPPPGIFAGVVTPTGEVIGYTQAGTGVPINDPKGAGEIGIGFVRPDIFSNGVSSLVTYTKVRAVQGEKNDILGTIIFKD